MDTKKCNGCDRGWSVKWKGYLHCVRWANPVELVFLELTPRAVETLLEFAEPDKPLRGLVIDVAKTKGGAKGRYVITVCERRIGEEEIGRMRPEDPLPVLRKLWLAKNQYVQDAE